MYSARGSALRAFARATLEQQEYELRVRADRMPVAVAAVAAARAVAAERLFELVEAAEESGLGDRLLASSSKRDVDVWFVDRQDKFTSKFKRTKVALPRRTAWMCGLAIMD